MCMHNEDEAGRADAESKLYHVHPLMDRVHQRRVNLSSRCENLNMTDTFKPYKLLHLIFIDYDISIVEVMGAQ